MSDFGRSGGDSPSRGDRFRYLWLFALASLVLLVLFSRFEGTFVILVAVYLVAVAAAAVVVPVRRGRS